MKLSEKLNDIAHGNTFYECALYEALYHPMTTKNDREMLMRYMYGSELLTDRIKLQELAIYISEIGG